MLPISKAMHAYFDSEQYKSVVETFTGQGVFWIEEEVVDLLSEDDWAQAVELCNIDTRNGSTAAELTLAS